MNYNAEISNSDLPDKLEQLASSNFYEYIRTKAIRFFTIGAVEFQKHDYFAEPSNPQENEKVEFLLNGCKQIINYKGLTKETAFENLCIEGFYSLMSLFHYKVVQQSTSQITSKCFGSNKFGHFLVNHRFSR